MGKLRRGEERAKADEEQGEDEGAGEEEEEEGEERATTLHISATSAKYTQHTDHMTTLWCQRWAALALAKPSVVSRLSHRLGMLFGRLDFTVTVSLQRAVYHQLLAVFGRMLPRLPP